MSVKWNAAAKRESGYSLIEILASLVILSIVTLALTAFFTNSLMYTKGNQSKTVMVNLARNALIYMEKQPFEPVQSYYSTYDEIACGAAGCSAEVGGLVKDATVLVDVLNPLVNGVQYKLSVEFQREIHNEMLADPDKKSMAQLLIPVVVKVERADGKTGSRNVTEVEGYISSEKIR